MKKNTAGQNLPFCMVNDDGTPGTGLTVSAFVTVDNGVQAAGLGTITEKGNGGYNYAPSQAETNGDSIQFLFTATGAVPSDYTVFTDAHFDPANDTVSADIASIALDAVAPGNLALMYNGTGYLDSTAPASRSQLDNLSSGSASISRIATSFVKSGAEPETGLFTNTATLDGIHHTVEDDAGTTDIYYETNIGGNGIPTEFLWDGYAQSNGDSYAVFAYNWSATQWDQIGTITASNGTIPISQNFQATVSHVGTGLDIGKVRIRFYSVDGTALATDRLLFSYSVVSLSVGYALGKIWVDTGLSNENTELFVDGVADNPVSTWAAALNIAAQLGIYRFNIAPGSSITLSGSVAGYEIDAYGATINLNTQNTSGAIIRGCTLVGNDSGINAIPALYFHCHFGVNTLGLFEALQSHLEGAAPGSGITLAEGGSYILDFCGSAVAGNNTPAITFPVADAFVSFRHYSGGIQINNMGAGDKMSLEGHGQCVIDSSCTGGALSIRGTIGPLTDNASGAVTVTQVARIATDGDSLPALTESLMIDTTIAAVTSQTVFTINGGSTDDNTYLNHLAIVTSATNPLQKSVASISGYVGLTGEVTLAVDPGIFTIAPGDQVEIIAVPLSSGGGGGATAAEIWSYASRSLTDKSGFNLDADQSAVTIGTVNLMAGTLQTLDALDAAQDSQHGLTRTDIANLDTAQDAEHALTRADITALGVSQDAQHSTTQAAIAAQNDISAAQVNAEMLDVMTVDTHDEPGQETPPAIASLAYKINFSYKFLINKKDQDASQFNLYNNAGTVVDQKAAVSDDTVTGEKGGLVTGP